MKQQVSPAVAVIAIVVAIGLAAVVWMQFGGVRHEDKPPPTMPPEIAKQWEKYTSGAQAGSSVPVAPTTAPPGGSSGSSIPMGAPR